MFILGRMGNAPRALCLIIDELEDIPQVRPQIRNHSRPVSVQTVPLIRLYLLSWLLVAMVCFERLRNTQAVEFVHDQRDDELWDVLISHASSSPHLTAALLQEIGSYCNPLRLLQQIPCGMCIPGLRYA